MCNSNKKTNKRLFVYILYCTTYYPFLSNTPEISERKRNFSVYHDLNGSSHLGMHALHTLDAN